ncbi:MAG: deoxyhypusine hydroxylase [Cirrosporium novae-zelandiae]|nr:MAG: deoxyhypusine hydroxylase [Cirrosporium novae-zelandiae]
MSNLEKVAPTKKRSPIPALKDALACESIPLATRFRALFSLKFIASQKPPTSEALEAIKAIANAFSAKSALLKHELAYCLGQTRNWDAVPFLTARIEDPKEEVIVKHEAAEALGALGHIGSLELLKKYRDDPNVHIAVRETCELAVDRIEWEASDRSKTETIHERYEYTTFCTILRARGKVAFEMLIDYNSDFGSTDPAPALPDDLAHRSIDQLEADLLNPKLSLFVRYRTMFALRELASPPDIPTAPRAIKALAAGFKDKSALFKHEVAFVFGQLSHPDAIPTLVAVLKDPSEADMVRHEAAEALGSLGDNEGVEDVLKQFINDPEDVVRESCIVALDMAEFEKSGEFDYTDIPQVEIEHTPAVAAATA